MPPASADVSHPALLASANVSRPAPSTLVAGRHGSQGNVRKDIASPASVNASHPVPTASANVSHPVLLASADDSHPAPSAPAEGLRGSQGNVRNDPAPHAPTGSSYPALCSAAESAADAGNGRGPQRNRGRRRRRRGGRRRRRGGAGAGAPGQAQARARPQPHKQPQTCAQAQAARRAAVEAQDEREWHNALAGKQQQQPAASSSGMAVDP